MWFARELAVWREFYLLVGTAGSTLVARLFVAASLAAGLIAADWEPSLDVLAGALLLLVLVNIRNVWDLTLTMVRQHRGPD